MNRDVPEFRLDELRERRTRYCVCVAVLDEGERIQRQLERMRPLADLADVVVADGGSTDGSLRLPALRPLGVRALLTKLGPGGLSAQPPLPAGRPPRARQLLRSCTGMTGTPRASATLLTG